MNRLNFMIASDFAPERFAGWYMLNTRLQRRSGINLHLLTPTCAQEQAHLLTSGTVDLVYANPFHATAMIRTQGYIALARPAHHFDEMVMVSNAQSSLSRIEDLQPGCRIAVTNHDDVKQFALHLLEPAGLSHASVAWVHVDSYQAAVRLLIRNEVQASIFLADAFASLSRLTRSQLRPLVESDIGPLSHVMLGSSRIGGQIPALQQALLDLGQDTTDRDVLDALGLPRGFDAMSPEDAESMLDQMTTWLN
ncbi:PhnD/SsuA/transferrin family substrate-binding protein [Rhodoferax sp.]|uniref:PhnD/SsuA/transferrin family substrate-binding protein n=1 Tax=Rhodoferax sp. TaxID=50421 RepID=UPI0026082504|nr:PhnD/SsuA/transferrin family substrate-binding protein [Rhodoferax sp.]MDD2925375.1 PhnD/SsuA/transferrin family substrate-binding protein [Rhodoferax sp.]